MNTAVINQSPFYGLHQSNEWKGGRNYPLHPPDYHLPIQNLLPIAGIKQLSIRKTAQDKWANLRSVYPPHFPIASPLLSLPYVALTSVKPHISVSSSASRHIQRGAQDLTTTSHSSTTATQRHAKSTGNKDYRHSVEENIGNFGYLIQNLRQESNNTNLRLPSSPTAKLVSYKDSLTNNPGINGMQEQQDFSLARKRSSTLPSGSVHSKKKLKNGQTQDDQLNEEYKNLEMDVANILISDIPFPVVSLSLSEVNKSPDTSQRGLQANVIVPPAKSGEVTGPETQVNRSNAWSTAMNERDTQQNKLSEGNEETSELRKQANRSPVGCGGISEPNPGENDPIVVSGALTEGSKQVNVPLVGNGAVSESCRGANTPQDNDVRLEAEKKTNNDGMDSNASLRFENEKENYSKNLVNSNKVVFTCQQCVVTFESTEDLISHTANHTNNNFTFKCNVCTQVFRSTNGLQKHVEFHADHRNNFLCSFCFKPFRDRNSLEEHIIASHMSKRPHKCSYCPKAFRDPGSLQKHVRIHTGERPYKCTACEKSFAEYSSLRKHYRVHTGEQPYKCQYCPKAFSISGNLQRHILIHTGERPYKCSECSKTFNNPSHLRRHEKNLHSKLESEK